MPLIDPARWPEADQTSELYRDPLGVIFEPDRTVIQVQAGNFILEPA